MTDVVIVREPQTMVRVEHAAAIVQAGQPGLPGPPGPPGGAFAAAGATPPAPAQDGQIWRDPASGRVMIYFDGSWRGAVIDGQHF